MMEDPEMDEIFKMYSLSSTKDLLLYLRDSGTKTLPPDVRRNFNLIWNLDNRSKSSEQELEDFKSKYLEILPEASTELRKDYDSKLKKLEDKFLSYVDDQEEVAEQTEGLIAKYLQELEKDLKRFQADDGQRKKDVWCICRKGYKGRDMIACSYGRRCLIEWYHLDCIRLRSFPKKGRWVCEECANNKNTKAAEASAKRKNPVPAVKASDKRKNPVPLVKASDKRKEQVPAPAPLLLPKELDQVASCVLS